LPVQKRQMNFSENHRLGPAYPGYVADKEKKGKTKKSGVHVYASQRQWFFQLTDGNAEQENTAQHGSAIAFWFCKFAGRADSDHADSLNLPRGKLLSGNEWHSPRR